MADSIVEIIHNLSFNVTGKGLDEAIRKLKEQGAGIDELKKKELELSEQIKKANNLNVNEMQRLFNERNKVKRLIEDETKALRDNFLGNKQLQGALRQEIALVSELEKELIRLRDLRAQSSDRNEIRRYETQMANAILATGVQLNNGVTGRLSRSFNEFNSVGGAFNQILRELPNAGISARTFIMSLTNNVTYFGESIARARLEGQSFRQILGSMGASLTGLVGILNIAVLAVTYLSLEYEKNSREAEQLEQNIDSLTAAIADQIRTVRELTDLRRETNSVLSQSEATLKRQIDFLKASGAAELEVFEAEQKYHSQRINNRKEEIQTIKDVENRANQLFKFYTDQGLRTETVNERVAAALAKTLKESTESTIEEANKQAEAYVTSYRERNGRIIPLERERLRLQTEVNDIESERNINAINFQREQAKQLEKEALEDAKRLRRSVRNERLRTRDLIELSPEEWSRQITQLEKAVNDFRERVRNNISTLTPSGVTSGPSGLNSVDSASDLPDLIQIARNNRDKEKEEDKKEAERIQQRKDNINSWVEAYQTAAYAIAQALDTIYQAQARSLDNEIRIREQRVSAAKEIAERGNAELLNIERQRLEQAQQERERVARRQIAVNSALQLSNAALAIARAAGEGGGYGSIALIAAVIAALATGYAAVQNLSSDTTPSFKDGVIGYKGKGGPRDDSNLVRISNGESVINAAATEKHRAILERINSGLPITAPVFNIPGISRSQSNDSDSKKMEKGLAAIVEAIDNSQVKVKQSMDARGLNQVVERTTMRNSGRFRR